MGTYAAGTPGQNVRLTNGTIILNFPGVQGILSSRITPNSTGAVALTPVNAAENVDFSAATGVGLDNTSLGPEV